MPIFDRLAICLATAAGGFLAVAFIGTQIFLFVGGLSYRKDFGNPEGTVSKDWTFTWLAPVPCLFRPNETGCVVHTGTRVALNAIGIASFEETTTMKIADKALAEAPHTDPETAYWVRTRSAIADYIAERMPGYVPGARHRQDRHAAWPALGSQGSRPFRRAAQRPHLRCKDDATAR